MATKFNVFFYLTNQMICTNIFHDILVLKMNNKYSNTDNTGFYFTNLTPDNVTV